MVPLVVVPGEEEDQVEDQRILCYHQLTSYTPLRRPQKKSFPQFLAFQGDVVEVYRVHQEDAVVLHKKQRLAFLALLLQC